jgi:hypothetical protein
MTLETLGAIEWLKQNPMRFNKWFWGSENKLSKDGLPNDFKKNIEDKMLMWAVTIPLLVTFILARATYEAFTK